MPFVRSTRPVRVMFAVVWAFFPAIFVVSLIPLFVTPPTEPSAGIADEVGARMIVAALMLAVCAPFGWGAWRQLGRCVRPAPDGTGLTLRGFRRTRRVAWADVLAVATEASAGQGDPTDGGSAGFAHTIVVWHDPGRQFPRAFNAASSFRPVPELAAQIRSWAPPGHAVNDSLVGVLYPR